MSRAPGLERTVGIGGYAFVAFNAVVGAGIFAMPGLVAGVLGPAAIIAYLVCMVLVGLVGLCFAEAGSRVPGTGGLYAYAAAAFGPVVGGVAGALLLFANTIASAAALARFFLDSLAVIWPAVEQPVLGIGLLSAFFAVLVMVNIAGTRDGARLATVLSVVKLAPLVVLVIASLFVLHPANLAWQGIPPLASIGEGSLLLVLAFIGIESALNINGETRNPTRSIPRGIALALAIVGVLYISVQLSAQGVLGAALTSSKTPLADTAGVVFGSWGARLLLIASIVSVGGYFVSDLLASPRVAFALAEAGQMPRWLAYVHPRHHTPAVAIIAYAVAVVALTATGSFRQLAVIGVSGTLLLYLIGCLGVLRMRAKGIAEAGPPFIAPGGPVVPLAASGIIVWLLSTLTWPELGGMLGFVVFFAIIFAIREARRSQPRPA